MTSPSANGLEVTVARTNGEPAFIGELRPDADQHRLNMRDVGLESVATEIEGIVSDDSIQLNVRVLRGVERPRKHAQPMLRRSLAS